MLLFPPLIGINALNRMMETATNPEFQRLRKRLQGDAYKPYNEREHLTIDRLRALPYPDNIKTHYVNLYNALLDLGLEMERDELKSINQ